jgi:glutamine phosphoribosylpyrophosphate amidotransferase
VCEILAASWPEPTRYERLHDWARGLEVFGLGGFGWGVAWLDQSGKVQLERGLGRYAEEAGDRDRLQQATSRRFLVHLRRPNKLSTVQLADTQPFAHNGDYAFCHNGFLERAEQLRPTYADRLEGQADSEVGWVFLQDRLADGATPAEAMQQLDETFGGKLNLGYLGADGQLAVYARNRGNALWRFRAGGADLVASALHSDDDSVFQLIFPDSSDPELIPMGTAVTLGDALET